MDATDDRDGDRRSVEGPTHPRLPAVLLMVGVVLLIVLLSSGAVQ